MAIVINVPRDERFGDLGSAGGKLLGTMIQKRRDDKDADLIAGVRSGEDAGSALGQVSPKNRAAVNAADAAFRAENPKQTLLTLDEGGGVASSRRGAFPLSTETPLDVAQFAKPRVATDTGSAIAEIRSTQINDNPVFANVPEAGRNRAARNIREEGKFLQSVKNTLEDKLGNLTGDNRIILSRSQVHYNNLIRGDGGETLVLDGGKAAIQAKRMARKDLQGFLQAQGDNALLTPEEHFGQSITEPVTTEDVTEPEAADAASPIRDLLSGFAETAKGLFQEQAPIETDTDVQVLDPAIRVEEATQLAIDSNYPVQDNEEWVEVSDGLPLVPQSMMDIVSVGNAAAVAPTYAQMANIPLHVALQLLQQNAGKAPTPTILKTKVISDPISDPTPFNEVPPPAPLSAEEQNRAAGGSTAPITVNRSPLQGDTPQRSFTVAPPGNISFPGNKQIVR